MKRVFGLARLATLSAGGANARSPLPDPARTPGAINPAVKQQTIHETICVPGWTRTVRPSTEYTSDLKRRQLRELGGADQRMRDYEEDHELAARRPPQNKSLLLLFFKRELFFGPKP
jgi:hypothetical protein